MFIRSFFIRTSGGHRSSPPVRRGYGRTVRLVPSKLQLPCPRPEIRHSNQRSLGKREIQEGRADREGCAQADLVDQQEGGDRPELVEGKDKREYLAELFAEPLVIEADLGEQVQAQRRSESGGDQHSPSENRTPGAAEGVANLLHVTQMKQGREIEA